MGSTVNICVTTHCKYICKYPVVYLDGKARVEISKLKYKKKTCHVKKDDLENPDCGQDRLTL